MKTKFLTYLTAIMATTAIAAPAALETETRDVAETAEVAGDASIVADNCFHRSSCSVSWSGKGEEYCDYRGFSHMTGDRCSWPKKSVCCIRV